MKFDNKKDAIAWALSQSQMTHIKHKVVYASAWFYDRKTEEYYLANCYTVIIK